jgi:hypothetical protein
MRMEDKTVMDLYDRFCELHTELEEIDAEIERRADRFMESEEGGE